MTSSKGDISNARLEYAVRRLEEAVKARVAPPGIAWKWVHSSVSAIPDVMYPYDPAVVRAIRNEFDSRVIPLSVKRVYRAQTGEERVIVVHCLGSYAWNPDQKPSPWTERGALIPTAGPIVRPTHIDFHHENKNLRKHDRRRYLPFDWRLYMLMRQMYDEHTKKERLRWAAENSPEAKVAAAAVKINEDREREARKFGPKLREHLENMVRDHDGARLLDEAKKKKAMVVVPG